MEIEEGKAHIISPTIEPKPQTQQNSVKLKSPIKSTALPRSKQDQKPHAILSSLKLRRALADQPLSSPFQPVPCFKRPQMVKRTREDQLPTKFGNSHLRLYWV